jgi:hypothetical protein
MTDPITPGAVEIAHARRHVDEEVAGLAVVFTDDLTAEELVVVTRNPDVRALALGAVLRLDDLEQTELILLAAQLVAERHRADA